MNSVTVIFENKLRIKEQQEPCNESELFKEQIIAAIRNVYDPELQVNIYDLGLIYDININENADVFVKMTLTAPGCPVAGSLPGEVECAIKSVEGVKNVDVELVWSPPWDQRRMTEEAKLALGLF